MDFTAASTTAFILYYYWKSQLIAGPGLAKWLFCTTLGLALIPIFLSSLVLVLIYRTIIHFILSLTDSRYNGLLNVGEVFYEREPEGALGVINVLGWVQPKSPNSTAEDLLEMVVKQAKMAPKNDKRSRILCTVKDWLGFRYWNLEGIDFDNQIRQFKASNTTELRDFLSDIACQPIFGKRIWEFYVGQSLIDGKYPIVLRIHHNYGHANEIRGFFSKLFPGMFDKAKKPRIHQPILEKSQVKIIGDLIVTAFHILLFAPTQIISQCLQPKDRHSLKADRLTTQKCLRWIKGDMDKVKAISSHTNLTSTEILLMAMSKALDDLFQKRGERVETISLFTPLRVPGMGQAIPVIMNLPVATERRRDDIVDICRRVRELPSYFMHSLLPRYFALLLPRATPQWVYDCTQFSAVLSNFPGVSDKLDMGEFVVETVFSFPPSVLDKNGLGVVVTLSAGQYHFAINMDKSLVKNENEPQGIVDGMVKFIDELYDSIKTKGS